MAYMCEICGVTFTTRSNLLRHAKSKHSNENVLFTCELCDRVFTRNYDLKRHINSIHVQVKHTCDVCGKVYNRADAVLQHKTTSHTVPPEKRRRVEPDEMPGPSTSREPAHVRGIEETPGPSHVGDMRQDETPGPSHVRDMHQDEMPGPSTSRDESPQITEEVFTLVDSAFKNRVKTNSAQWYIHGDILTVLNNLKPHIVQKLKNEVNVQQAIIFNVALECEFTIIKNSAKMYNFKTKNEAVYMGSDIELLVERHVTKLVSEFEECVMKGSGWYFICVSGLEVRVNKHRPLHGGGYIPLINKLKH